MKRTKIVIVLSLLVLVELVIIVRIAMNNNSGDSKMSPVLELMPEIEKPVSEAYYSVMARTDSADMAGADSIDIHRNLRSTRWESDVRDIESRYGGVRPHGDIIFYGSSSIRKWKTLDEDMNGLDVLNHGFGGSTTASCLYYADRLVGVFEPAAVVYYAGTNDIGRGKTVNETYLNTIDFFRYIHYQVPDAAIYYVAQTQQPARTEYWDQMRELNSAVRKYTENRDYITYIDTESELNNEDGTPRRELFVSDGLHFNSEGYKEWTSIIRPILYSDLL